MGGEHDASQERQRRVREELIQQVGAKEERKLKARGERNHDVWFWLGMFGLVGWSVALPTVIGVALGVWIDKSWPSRFSWTLMLLFIGVALGCMNAWYWIKRESRGA
ncbi:MAG TPA: AtpZ/AtpI family protein [Candidatus Tectomicrobia bacterium]|nr:AtpZ/AtpI family protein [Candidatus Tectomicrobia bacterium]